MLGNQIGVKHNPRCIYYKLLKSQCLSEIKNQTVALVVTKLFFMLKLFQLLGNNGTKLATDVAFVRKR
ncbi:unnamed protein product [Rotaria magnacalcarata]